MEILSSLTKSTANGISSRTSGLVRFNFTYGYLDP